MLAASTIRYSNVKFIHFFAGLRFDFIIFSVCEKVDYVILEVVFQKLTVIYFPIHNHLQGFRY